MQEPAPVLGSVGLFGVLQPAIDVLLIVQAIWFVAAGVALAVRSGAEVSGRCAA